MRSFSIALLMCVFFYSVVSVADSGFNGNKRKGKYLLRKIYKQCQSRGEVSSSTPLISPADRTQAQWTTLYNVLKEGKGNKKTEELMKSFGCIEEWAKINKKTRLDIFTYMYKHASDSSTPAKCK